MMLTITIITLHNVDCVCVDNTPVIVASVVAGAIAVIVVIVLFQFVR